MPSTNKTQYVGLNKWTQSDKPKMDDFNLDNQRLDDLLMAHMGGDSRGHLTEAQASWLAAPYRFGGYTGDGNGDQEIHLGFKPRFVVAFACGLPMVEYNPGAQYTDMRFAMGFEGSCSNGLEITDSGFKVLLNTGSVTAGSTAIKLNMKNLPYGYMVFR